MIRHAAVLALTLVGLTACEKPQPVNPPPGSTAPGAPPPSKAVTPVVVAVVPEPARLIGPARTVQPVAGDDLAMDAVHVTAVHNLAAGGKIFSTAAGDPAVNGLYTYLGLFQNNADGWRVFQIGDVESWKVVEEAPGRVVLQVVTSAADEATGTIAKADGTLIVQYAGAGASRITVTPAG